MSSSPTNPRLQFHCPWTIHQELWKNNYRKFFSGRINKVREQAERPNSKDDAGGSSGYSHSHTISTFGHSFFGPCVCTPYAQLHTQSLSGTEHQGARAPGSHGCGFRLASRVSGAKAVTSLHLSFPTWKVGTTQLTPQGHHEGTEQRKEGKALKVLSGELCISLAALSPLPSLSACLCCFSRNGDSPLGSIQSSRVQRPHEAGVQEGKEQA